MTYRMPTGKQEEETTHNEITDNRSKERYVLWDRDDYLSDSWQVKILDISLQVGKVKTSKDLVRSND